LVLGVVMATHLDEIYTAIIVGIFVMVVGAFLLSVVWRLYRAGSNDQTRGNGIDI
jgi:xanthine/uracil permease